MRKKKGAKPKMEKKKKAADKPEGEGRPNALKGKKLYKVEPKEGTRPLQEGKQRFEALKALRSGQSYDSYISGGGAAGVMAYLVKKGFVEARDE